MRAMDLIWLACFRAALAMMKPKDRLAYLKAVSDIVGDPAVTPLMSRDAGREVETARETWARLLPKMAA